MKQGRIPLTLLAVSLGLLLLAGCGSAPAGTEKTTAAGGNGTEGSTAVQTAADTAPETQTGTGPAPTAEERPAFPETEAQSPEESSGAQDEVIAKINGAADETGIYSLVITLSDRAADKGCVEMVYYGPKGTPQEASVVNTYRIEYSREADGSFEIRTFYDGKTDQNQHGKSAVKVTNTFSAALRAGSVVISYTPEGGTTREIYRADAGQFRRAD